MGAVGHVMVQSVFGLNLRQGTQQPFEYLFVICSLPGLGLLVGFGCGFVLVWFCCWVGFCWFVGIFCSYALMCFYTRTEHVFLYSFLL